MHRAPGLLFCLLAAAAAATNAHASVALLMEEPYGEFGAVNPTGHAAVYFNHICADSPTGRATSGTSTGDMRTRVNIPIRYS